MEGMEVTLGNRYKVQINKGKTKMLVMRMQGMHTQGILAGEPLENVEKFI